MQLWFNFYAVIGTAAATLMGLLFVAVSLNAAAALRGGTGGLRGLTEQAFENYLAVLMVSLLALFPDISLMTFGRITLLVTATWSVWVIVRLYHILAEPSGYKARFFATRRHVSTLAGFGLLIYSAARMALNGKDMRNAVAAASIVLLFSATERAWNLLNRIAGIQHIG